MALIYEPTKYRPVKILMRVDLLRDADKAILEQLGGHEDRHELFNEAIQQYLVELRTGGYVDGADDHDAAGDADDNASASIFQSVKASAAMQGPVPTIQMRDVAPVPTIQMPDVAPVTNLADTVVHVPENKPALFTKSDAVPKREPLLGLHNADIPTIDALAFLARETVDGPIPVKSFYDTATQRARELSVALAPYEKRYKVRLSALLPSNMAKAQAAARGYQAFALGHINKELRDDGKLDCWGPMYLWGVVGVVRDNGDTKIGVTETGWRLLEEMDGITFERPHTPDHARRFLHFLHVHAPEDLWGLMFLLQAVGEGVGRVELNARFLVARDWKESIATSVAQGYLARSREWGLVTPKLVEGRYELTTFGREMRGALAAGEDIGDDAQQKDKGRRGRRVG